MAVVDAAVPTLDIEAKQNGAFRLQVTVYNPLSDTDPPQPDLTSPMDFTGHTAAMQVRKSHSQAVLLELTTENGGVTLGGRGGTVDLYADDDAMGALSFTVAVQDLWVKPNGGDREYLWQGKFVLEPAATHA